MEFPRTGQCVLLRDLLPLVPKLKKIYHLGQPIYDEDDPNNKWEFYAPYSVETKLRYTLYRFAYGINSDRIQPEEKQCLREMIHDFR